MCTYHNFLPSPPPYKHHRPTQMDRQSDSELMMDNDHLESKNKACLTDAVGCLQIYCLVGCSLLRECIKLLVNHRRFQQCILLAILINTLSMGIEYHNQVNKEQNDLPCSYYLFILYLLFIYFYLSSSLYAVIPHTRRNTKFI